MELTEPKGCLISLQGRPNRRVDNWNETMAMMKKVFRRVQVWTLTQYHTTDETVRILQDALFCLVFMVQATPMPRGVGVVEMIGNAKPAYFRNINMLLGQYYGMSGPCTVNLTEAKGAFFRANEHARLWIESYGHWTR